jgi:hypothetical protein
MQDVASLRARHAHGAASIAGSIVRALDVARRAGDFRYRQGKRRTQQRVGQFGCGHDNPLFCSALRHADAVTAPRAWPTGHGAQRGRQHQPATDSAEKTATTSQPSAVGNLIDAVGKSV